MKNSYLKMFILVLLNLLFIGGIYLAYQKIEEARAIKNYNQQLSKVIQEEEAVEKDKDTSLQKGMVGQSYVAAYYPKNNEEPITVVKERILADIGSLPQEEKKNQQAKELLFYHTERSEDPFVGVHPYQVKKTQYKWKNGKFIKDEIDKLPLLYLTDEGTVFQFSQLFTDTDLAKETLLLGETGFLTFSFRQCRVYPSFL